MAEFVDPIEIPVTLGGLDQAKQQLIELKKVADDATSPDQMKAGQAYKKLKKDVMELNEAFKDQVAVQKDLTKEYVRNEEGMVELTAQISLMEDKMYDLVLAGQQNTEEYEALRNKTAEFKQIIIETDKEIDLLAENKGLGAISAGLGQIGDRLLKLDFEGAAKDATLLNKNMGNLSKIGTKSLKGLGKTVGQLSKSFLKFGVSLLANPVFLLTAAIVAIVVAIGALLNKLGFLKPILDGIGKVFGWIADLIGTVVDGFKALTDWLGFTDFAGEEQARKEIDRLDRIADKVQKVTDKRVRMFDEEAKIAQVRGESTLKIEEKKNQVILKNAQRQRRIARQQLKIGRRKGILDDEEIKRLKEKIKQNTQLARQSASELRILKVKEEEERKKAAAEEKKEAERKQKEEDRIRKENAAKAKRFRQNRLTAERKIQDLLLAELEDGTDKEIKIAEEKYKRLIEDTKRNETLLQKEKTKIIELLEIEQKQVIDEINKKAKEEEEKEQREFQEMISAIYEEEAANRQEEIERAAQARIDSLKKEATEEQKLTQEFQDAIKEIERRKEEELADLREEQRLDELNRKLELNDLELQARIDILDQLMMAELDNKELTETEKLLIEQKYAELRKAARDEEEQAQKEQQRRIVEFAIDGANQTLDAIGNLNDLAFEIRKGKLKEGSAEEEKAARRNFEINKKLQIAQAVVQGVQAVIAAYSSGAAVPVVGAVLGPLYAGFAAIATAAQIAKIKNTTFGSSGSSGGGGGGGAAPSIATSTQVEQASPGLSLFGGANQGNNLGPAQENDQTLNIDVTAEVSAVEMDKEQKKLKQQEENASL